ncbi:secondary thiamine-phosphate synthase enzyme YjbQ [Pseudoroseomonas globiformis]|uniref:Secondary thiamine-phosphate synthase enzyme YjbQ n=1 Tax=Teichococcus globiformis TaxID=2307229 RepID=A0ABV7G8D3_9PROT
MRQASHRLEVPTRGRGFIEITAAVRRFVAEQGIREGLLTVWCRHTSASLIVQENASPDVLQDLGAFLARLAPEGPHYRHDDEGPDDMPAHLRMVLTQVQLSIPVLEGAPVLGTWQGVFLCEHRAAPHRREVVLHLIGQ